MTLLSKQERELAIWRNMTAKDRDYDRLAGRIPYGASRAYETDAGQKAADQRAAERESVNPEACCSCHIMPPCSYCTSLGEDEV